MRRPRARRAERDRRRGRRGRRRGRAGAQCGNLLARHARASDAHRPAVRPPRHRAARRRRSSRCSSTGAGRAPGDTILGADNKAAVAVMLELARRCAVEGRPCGSSCCSPSARRTRWRAPRPSTSSALRSRLRLRVRPRDRRSARSSWPRRPTSASRPRSAAAPRTPASGPRTGAARSRRPPARSRRCGSAASTMRRPPTSATIDGRRGGDERRARALHVRWPRRARHDAASVEAVVAEMVDQHPRRGQRPGLRVRRRRRRSSGCSTAIATRPAPRRSMAAEAALRACGYEPRRDPHRRRLGRQRARGRPGFPCTNLANGTERNHEPDERVSVRGAGGHARRRASPCWTRPRRRLMLGLRRGTVVGGRCRGRAGSSARGRRRRRAQRPAIADVGLVGRPPRSATRSSSTSRPSSSPRLGRLRRRARQPDARPRWRRRRGRARDEAQLHEPPARRASAVEGEHGRRVAARAGPSAVFALHGQLPPSPGPFAPGAGGVALGYVQTAGGALPGGPLARRARPARARPAGRSRHRGARATAARARRSRPPARCTTALDRAGLGRGVVRARPRASSGSATRPRPRRAGGAGHRAHRAGARLPRSCSRRACPSGDPRARHQGMSHHTRRCSTCCSRRSRSRSLSARRRRGRGGGTHGGTSCAADLDGYAPAACRPHDGPPLDEDPLFFAAALAAGTALGGHGRRA